MTSEGIVNTNAVSNLKEAARWAVRTQRLLCGGISGAVINDTRTSLEIIERYINKAIGIIQRENGGDQLYLGESEDPVPGRD